MSTEAAFTLRVTDPDGPAATGRERAMEARRQPSPQGYTPGGGDLEVEKPSHRITTQVPITQIVQVQEISALDVV